MTLRVYLVDGKYFMRKHFKNLNLFQIDHLMEENLFLALNGKKISRKLV